MRLLLARHAQSVWNEIRRFQGSTDVGLSEINASLTVVEPPRLVSLNDTAHLRGERAPAPPPRAPIVGRPPPPDPSRPRPRFPFLEEG